MMIRKQEHPINIVLNINCEVNGFVYFSFVRSDWPLQCKWARPTENMESCWRKIMGCKVCKVCKCKCKSYPDAKIGCTQSSTDTTTPEEVMRRMRCSIGLQNSWCVARVCKLLNKNFLQRPLLIDSFCSAIHWWDSSPLSDRA